MTSSEVASKVNDYFNGQAKAYSVSKYKVEVDVSKELQTKEWAICASKFNMIDNSKSIPNSWKLEDITVVFFYGPLQKFIQKGNTNWKILSRPQNSQRNMEEYQVQ